MASERKNQQANGWPIAKDIFFPILVVMTTARFKDKTYLIIGGSSGIGFAAADALVKEEALVTIAGRNDKKLAQAARV